MSAPAARAAAAGPARTARAIALAALLLYAFAGGGRVVGSDEVTMYDLAHALLRGRLDVPVGATRTGPDGREYTKNAAGQAVLALPLVALGEAAARAAHLPPARAELAARFTASFFNAAVTALLLAALYALARRLGVRAGAALAATALLGFTTPVAVYAKSFMAEPLEALGLLLVVGAGPLAAVEEGAAAARAGWLAALGALLAVAVKPGMLLPVAAALAGGFAPRPARLLRPLAGLAVAALTVALYDLARFHDVLQTGYGGQASPAAFTTPLAVGLYGLLVSSGKGVLWFAPALALAPWGVADMRRRRAHAPAARAPAAAGAARALALAWLAGLAQYATFQHWAGDGSWGPRYLVPLLPPAFLAVAFALDGASRARRRVAWALGALGLAVQLGGLGIYFGAEMRAVGDYPYTRPLDDPHFMEASHFNPRYSPIAVHWRMLAANLDAHLHGRAPRLGAGGARDPRLGIAVADERALLGAIDVWWLYAHYAGLAFAPLAAAALALLAAGAWAARRARALAAREARAP